MKKVIRFLPYGAAFMPMFAFAQSLNYFETIVTEVQDIVELLIPLAIAIGLLFFIWGLVQYILNSGDEEAKEEGKRKMIWGVLALFVIVSVWGLVGLLQNILDIKGDDIIPTPGIPGS